MELEGKRVVVVGLARSGVAAARHLARRGARVVATDRKGAEELSPEAVSLKEMGVELELGAHRDAAFEAADVVVVSPGVPHDLPALVAARRRGVPVIAEIELAYRELRGAVVAVTGTKGKSTTTAALGRMLAEAGRDARVGGNIGAPLIGLVSGSTEKTVFVVEVSSFQLQGIDSFHARVAVFLNVSEDHLDRHTDFAEYVAAKARIFENQTADDLAVINADDPVVLELARRSRAPRVLFSPKPGRALEEGAFFSSGSARLRRGGRDEALFSESSVRLPGAHLRGDLLAAATAARLMGAPSTAIDRAVSRFEGVEHVLERVATVGGVTFYNDSKATNVDAARRSVEAFEGPLVVLLGGRYKGGDFRDLVPALQARRASVVTLGEAAPRIAADLQGAVDVSAASRMDDAVRQAFARSGGRGDVVLAPACSSFDMFRDYAERGRAFKEAVRRLEAERAATEVSRG